MRNYRWLVRGLSVVGLMSQHYITASAQDTFEPSVPYQSIGSSSLTSLADETPQFGQRSTSGVAIPTSYYTTEMAEEDVAKAKGLTESDVKKIIDKHLKDKEAEKESKLTDKEKKDRDLAMTAKWNDGLELQTKNKHFRTHIGGRYQLDTAWFSTPANVNQNINTPYGDGMDFRRARMRIDGTLYEVYDYACEFDFVNSIRIRNQPVSVGAPGFVDETITAPTDLWWSIKELPVVGNMKIGNQKEQIGFEHIVSSRYQPFMERSYNQDTFYGGLYNGFQPGVTVYNTYGNESGVWNVGLFKPTNNVFSSANGDGDYAVTGRLTRLLAYDNDGRQLLHVGISGRQASTVSYAGVPGGVQVYRTRDAVRSGLSSTWPTPASISLFGDDQQWLNSELVGVWGAWTFQSEYLVSGLHNASTTLGGPNANIVYNGGYAQIMYFLTGENDHYSKKNGVFERVRPNTNFFKPNKCGGISGMGAWQVGIRYNHLDLNDKGFNGGILDNWTAGLNWFWNPNMKWQFNYMATDRNVANATNPSVAAGSGWIHGFGTRLAFDF